MGFSLVKCKCPWRSKSNKQFRTSWFPFSYSLFNSWIDSWRLNNVRNNGLSRIVCKESISACCSHVLYWCKRSVKRFKIALASINETEKMRKRKKNDANKTICQWHFIIIYLPPSSAMMKKIDNEPNASPEYFRLLINILMRVFVLFLEYVTMMMMMMKKKTKTMKRRSSG